MGGVGLEPTPSCEVRILSPVRLPVPPPAQFYKSYLLLSVIYNLFQNNKRPFCTLTASGWIG